MARRAPGRVSLSQLNTGPVVHNLYVLTVGGAARAANDQKSRDLTLAILKYVHERLEIFTTMGVKIRVHKVKKSDLANPRLVEAMKARGISSLPALVTPNSTYVGNRAIGDVYEKNIMEYEAWKRRDVEGPSGMVAEDDLASFYQDEMTFERAAQEDDLGDEGDGIGEGGDMMDSYRSMMQKREGREQRPGGPRPPQPRPPAGSGGRPPAGSGGNPPARRPDNVARGGSGDDILDSLIDRMAGDIDSQTFEQAFAGGGGDSLDEEGLDTGGNAQDDIMESAYWANQEMSM